MKIMMKKNDFFSHVIAEFENKIEKKNKIFFCFFKRFLAFVMF